MPTKHLLLKLTCAGAALAAMALVVRVDQRDARAAPPPSPPASSSLQNIYVDISDRLMPSVVNISTTQKARATRAFPGFMPGMPGDPFGELFPGLRPEGPPREGPRAQALGTGFIVEADGSDGLIVTNYHVIAGADEIRVKFTEKDDEKEVTAALLGKDPELDVAVLKVHADHKLQAVALGDSDRLKVGEWVAAAGNPFGHGHSISHGIVSAKERALQGGFGKYVQVDAPINPGNSGGPLVNLAGEVVGINNAIDARGTGIGFAIPINAVKSELARLESGKAVERGFLGVNLVPLREDLARAMREDASAGALMVAQVAPDSPAALAGIETYDVVASLDGKPMRSADEVRSYVMQLPIGQRVAAELIRGGRHMNVEVAVAKRPEREAE
jgi:serine protease Do